MYQAIVFLPLLGAILAGVIALVGARARCPGEGPPPGLEEGAAASGSRRACGARPRMLTTPTMVTTPMAAGRPPPDRARPN